MNYKELIVECFNEYHGENTEVLDKLYDPGVVFEDPLTKVTGLEAVKKYFKHAYAPTQDVEFDFKEIHGAGLVYACEWTMSLRAKPLNFGRTYKVRGASIMTFSESSGKVIRHNDYLDVGDMVYEKIPGLGSAIKFIKSRLS